MEDTTINTHLEKEVGKPGLTQWSNQTSELKAAFKEGLQKIRKADLVFAKQKKGQIQRNRKILGVGARFEDRRGTNQQWYRSLISHQRH